MRGVVLGGTRREGEGPEGEGGRQRGLKLITFPLHPRWSRGARPPPSPLTQRGEGPAVGVAALHAERVHQAVVALHGDAGQGEDLGHHGRALGERHHLADEGTCGRRQGTHQREKAGCVFVLSLRFKGCVYSHTAERHAQRYRRRLAPWGALSSQAVIRTEQGQGLGEGQQRWLALPAGEQAGGGGGGLLRPTPLRRLRSFPPVPCQSPHRTILLKDAHTLFLFSSPLTSCPRLPGHPSPPSPLSLSLSQNQGLERVAPGSLGVQTRLPRYCFKSVSPLPRCVCVSDVFAFCVSPACHLRGGCASLVATICIALHGHRGHQLGDRDPWQMPEKSCGPPCPQAEAHPPLSSTALPRSAGRAPAGSPIHPFLRGTTSPVPPSRPALESLLRCHLLSQAVPPVPSLLSVPVSLIPLSSLALSPAGSPAHARAVRFIVC